MAPTPTEGVKSLPSVANSFPHSIMKNDRLKHRVVFNALVVGKVGLLLSDVSDSLVRVVAVLLSLHFDEINQTNYHIMFPFVPFIPASTIPSSSPVAYKGQIVPPQHFGGT